MHYFISFHSYFHGVSALVIWTIKTLIVADASSSPDPLLCVNGWNTTWLILHTKQKQKGHVELLGSQNGLFSPYIALKQAWQRAVISAMHQIAQWRGREADSTSSVTTRRSLYSRVSFGTCAQGSGKSRWHVGGESSTTQAACSVSEHLSFALWRHCIRGSTRGGREKLLLSRTLLPTLSHQN